MRLRLQAWSNFFYVVQQITIRICNIGVQTLAPYNMVKARIKLTALGPKRPKRADWELIVSARLLGRTWRRTFDLPRMDSHVQTSIQGDTLCPVLWIFQSWLWYQPSSSKWYCHAEWTEIAPQDVLHDAILPYAFSTSSYPLILSIENHCTKEQQDKMAHHFKNILGNLLYTQPVDTSRWTNVKYLNI